jgi:hypothetical protein
MARYRSAKKIFLISALAIGTCVIASPGFTQTRDHAPVDLQSAPELTQDKAGKENWTYINPDAELTKYRAVTIEPGVVYNGPDAQFDGVSDSDRAKYAAIMTAALRSEIAKSFPASAGARANTIRVHFDLIGIQNTVGGVATATRVTPIGFGLSALKSITGRQGTLTGSVLFSVQAYDAKTGKLLFAAVRRRTPDPLDIPATLSTTDTVKAVARDFAATARQRLVDMTGAPTP